MSDLNTSGIQWSAILFFAAYHACLFVGLPAYIYFRGWPSAGIWLSALVLFVLISFSITAGYHRLFSHRTYKASWPVQAFFLFFGNMAAQYSALEWSHDHRKHHAYSDTKKDPYTVRRGFLHAHIIWILRKAPKKSYSSLPDLTNNPLVLLQYKLYYPLYIVQNVAVTLLIGFFTGDYFGAIVFTYLLRTFVSHHSTFLVNSLAHTAGKRPHKKDLTAADNYFVSLLTFGEGYHNYHHAFPHDYRNGPLWYNYDPSKWLIWCLSKIGLSKDLKRAG